MKIIPLVSINNRTNCNEGRSQRSLVGDELLWHKLCAVNTHQEKVRSEKYILLPDLCGELIVGSATSGWSRLRPTLSHWAVMRDTE